jgi:hypothetical protein
VSFSAIGRSSNFHNPNGDLASQTEGGQQQYV